MKARIAAWPAIGVGLSVAFGGCANVVPAAQMTLDVSNGTTVPVTLVVNGTTIEAIQPGSGAELSTSELPGLPWVARVMSPSGRELVMLVVHDGDVYSSRDGKEQHGVAQRVDLSCGRIDLWSGPPLAGPAPNPGTPGDCD
jgi:hypothetical protein